MFSQLLNSVEGRLRLFSGSIAFAVSYALHHNIRHWEANFGRYQKLSLRSLALRLLQVIVFQTASE